MGSEATLASLLSSLSVTGGPSSRPAPPVRPRGLVNDGNLCFANATLQALVFTPAFRALFDGIASQGLLDLAGAGDKARTIEAVIMFLKEFELRQSSTTHNGVPGSRPVSQPPPPSSSAFPSLTASASVPAHLSSAASSQSWADAFLPSMLFDALAGNRRFDSMRRGTQEDAEEFLGFLVETLQEEMLVVQAKLEELGSSASNGKGKSKQVDDDDDWLEVGTKGRTAVSRTMEVKASPLTQLFGGQLRSVLRRPREKDSITSEPFERLQLDIQSPDVRTVQDAILYLCKRESVSMPSARGPVQASKQLYLDSFPPVLVMHLKRFVFTAAGAEKNKKKVAYHETVEIPPEAISPSKRKGPVKYKLLSVINHHGSSSAGGHYTVCVRNPASTTTSWLRFDDTHIQAVPQSEVLVSWRRTQGMAGGWVAQGGGEGDAYLLFYERVD